MEKSSQQAATIIIHYLCNDADTVLLSPISAGLKAVSLCVAGYALVVCVVADRIRLGIVLQSAPRKCVHIELMISAHDEL